VVRSEAAARAGQPSDAVRAALERRDSRAGAEALLRALKAENCPLDDLTLERYSEARRRHPHIGLPRATTVERACGSWGAAVDQAAALAAGAA
jgi:hypothetical protein